MPRGAQERAMRGVIAVLLILPWASAQSESCDALSHLQLESKGHAQRIDAATRMVNGYNRSLAKRMGQTVLLQNNLYWQGYGGQTLWSYFIGFLGEDQVGLGGVKGNAKLGLNMIGNAPLGNMYQSVSTDSGMLGLLPGCFAGECSGPHDYDDLLSALARGGKMERAFTMCFDDSPEGGGQLYLGKPELPSSAISISMVPLTSGQTFYSPLSTFDDSAFVEFYFGHVLVGSQKVLEWNNMMKRGMGYSDTGTPGLLLPPHVLTKIVDELRTGVAQDSLCQSLWGYQLQSLSMGAFLEVSEAAAECAFKYLKDFEVKLGHGVSMLVSKSSFFYETEPCSGRFGISWSSSGSDAMVFGTAWNYGKTVLYDTSDLAEPKMVVLGAAGGCTTDYSAEGAKPIAMKGVAGQVLGEDGTITAELEVGTPGQPITVQLDTGSQKFMGIHNTCRNLGNCFLVQPADGKNTVLFPGNEYQTPQCQAQIRDLSKALFEQSCYAVQDRTLCECSSQEECLSRVVRAAAQNVVPNKICAITRKMCGEVVDFQPEYSSTFTPTHFPSFPFVKPPGSQVLKAQCHLTHLCHRSPLPLTSSRGRRNDAPTGDGYSDGSDGSDDSGYDPYSGNYEEAYDTY